MLTALWGLIYWREFTEADAKDKTYMFIHARPLRRGIGAVSVAPLFSAAPDLPNTLRAFGLCALLLSNVTPGSSSAAPTDTLWLFRARCELE